jgi:hypothetical protein
MVGFGDIIQLPYVGNLFMNWICGMSRSGSLSLAQRCTVYTISGTCRCVQVNP